ncbi:hypothetical protein FACS189419_06420 [Planctomycetales bacterium]|nr:hypothetical protein FACS189419_06420 [Planctomycetales bacterium]
MKTDKFLLIGIPILSLIAGVSVFFWAVSLRSSKPVEKRIETLEPQCAHWSILRCCQLLGAPVTLKALLEFLPYQEEGHSMLQMAEILKKIGKLMIIRSRLRRKNDL